MAQSTKSKLSKDAGPTTVCFIGLPQARSKLPISTWRRCFGGVPAHSRAASYNSTVADHDGFLNDQPDGEFGPNTRAAIRQFKAQSGDPEDEFLTAQERQQLLQGKPSSNTAAANSPSEISAKAAHLAPNEAATQCQSSDTETRLIGCTAIIDAKAPGCYLEPISKSSEEDNEAGELDKAEEVLSVVLPADEDATLPLYPGEEALDEPASHVTV